MTIIPQSAMTIADAELRGYFNRQGRKLSYREAQKLIDYVSGPAPEPSDMAAMDYSRPRVRSGGGRARPSDADIEAILRRHSKDRNEWEEVIEEFLDRMRQYPNERRFVIAEYRDKLGMEGVMEKLKISRRTYFRRKQKVLTYLVLLSAEKGLIKI